MDVPLSRSQERLLGFASRGIGYIAHEDTPILSALFPWLVKSDLRHLIRSGLLVHEFDRLNRVVFRTTEAQATAERRRSEP